MRRGSRSLEEEDDLLKRIAGRLIAVGLLMGTAAGLQASVLTLSNAVAFGAAADGAWSNGITTTSGCCQFINIESGSFTGDLTNYVSTPIGLNPGANIFYLESSDWTAGFGVTNGGLNLYFNGDAAPDISAMVTPTYDQTDFGQPFSAIANAVTTANIDDSGVLGSGALSYSGGGQTVALIGYQWVGGSGVNPYNSSLTVQQVELYVSGAGSTTPEPGTLVMLAAGLVGLGALRRRFHAA
jgi:hypothetical protein